MGRGNKCVTEVNSHDAARRRNSAAPKNTNSGAKAFKKTTSNADGSWTGTTVMFEDGSTLVYDLPPYEKYPFENSERLDPPLSKAEFFDQYIRDEYEGYAPPDPNAPPYALPQTLEEVTPGCLDDPSCFRGSNLPSSRGAFPGL